MTAVTPDDITRIDTRQEVPAAAQARQETVIVTPQVGYGWVIEGVRRYLGYILVVAGLLAIFLGWYGSSGETVVAKQIPYLASGGLLGIALIVLGGRVLLIDDLRRDSGRLDRLELMVHELHAVLIARAELDELTDGRAAHLNGSHAAASSRGARNGRAAAAETGPIGFQVVTGGNTYHLPDCPMTEGKRRTTVSPPTIAKRGLTPCPLCEPGDVVA